MKLCRMSLKKIKLIFIVKDRNTFILQIEEYANLHKMESSINFIYLK